MNDTYHTRTGQRLGLHAVELRRGRLPLPGPHSGDERVCVPHPRPPPLLRRRLPHPTPTPRRRLVPAHTHTHTTHARPHTPHVLSHTRRTQQLIASAMYASVHETALVAGAGLLSMAPQVLVYQLYPSSSLTPGGDHHHQWPGGWKTSFRSTLRCSCSAGYQVHHTRIVCCVCVCVCVCCVRVRVRVRVRVLCGLASCLMVASALAGGHGGRALPVCALHAARGRGGHGRHQGPRGLLRRLPPPWSAISCVALCVCVCVCVRVCDACRADTSNTRDVE